MHALILVGLLIATMAKFIVDSDYAALVILIPSWFLAGLWVLERMRTDEIRRELSWIRARVIQRERIVKGISTEELLALEDNCTIGTGARPGSYTREMSHRDPEK